MHVSALYRAALSKDEGGGVRAEEAGTSRLCSMNGESLLAEPLLALVRLRGRLLARLVGDLERWALPARHVSLFGSAARGDGDTHSDIDVFVVRPDGIDEDQPTWRGLVRSELPRVRYLSLLAGYAVGALVLLTAAEVALWWPTVALAVVGISIVVGPLGARRSDRYPGRDSTRRYGFSAVPGIPRLAQVRGLAYGPAPRPAFAEQPTAVRVAPRTRSVSTRP
jgi:predicted nucleotidyltransferase